MVKLTVPLKIIFMIKTAVRGFLVGRYARLSFIWSAHLYTHSSHYFAPRTLLH